MALRIKKVNRKSLLESTLKSETSKLVKKHFQIMKEAMRAREISYVVDLRFED